MFIIAPLIHEAESRHFLYSLAQRFGESSCRPAASAPPRDLLEMHTLRPPSQNYWFRNVGMRSSRVSQGLQVVWMNRQVWEPQLWAEEYFERYGTSLRFFLRNISRQGLPISTSHFYRLTPWFILFVNATSDQPSMNGQWFHLVFSKFIRKEHPDIIQSIMMWISPDNSENLPF